MLLVKQSKTEIKKQLQAAEELLQQHRINENEILATFGCPKIEDIESIHFTIQTLDSQSNSFHNQRNVSAQREFHKTNNVHKYQHFKSHVEQLLGTKIDSKATIKLTISDESGSIQLDNKFEFDTPIKPLLLGLLLLQQYPELANTLGKDEHQVSMNDIRYEFQTTYLLLKQLLQTLGINPDTCYYASMYGYKQIGYACPSIKIQTLSGETLYTTKPSTVDMDLQFWLEYALNESMQLNGYYGSWLPKLKNIEQ